MIHTSSKCTSHLANTQRCWQFQAAYSTLILLQQTKQVLTSKNTSKMPHVRQTKLAWRWCWTMSAAQLCKMAANAMSMLQSVRASMVQHVFSTCWPWAVMPSKMWLLMLQQANLCPWPVAWTAAGFLHVIDCAQMPGCGQ